MKKALLIIAVLLLVLIGTAVWFYQSIQNDFFAEHDDAIQVALSHTSLTRADHVDYYAGEAPVRIVYGVNAENEKLIVWVSDDDIHEEKAANGVDREQIHKLVADRHGQVEWIRLVPGMYQETLVWEAFFKRSEQAGVRHYYEYYRFQDGARVDTLRLGLE